MDPAAPAPTRFPAFSAPNPPPVGTVIAVAIGATAALLLFVGAAFYMRLRSRRVGIDAEALGYTAEVARQVALPGLASSEPVVDDFDARIEALDTLPPYPGGAPPRDGAFVAKADYCDAGGVPVFRAGDAVDIEPASEQGYARVVRWQDNRRELVPSSVLPLFFGRRDEEPEKEKEKERSATL